MKGKMHSSHLGMILILLIIFQSILSGCSAKTASGSDSYATEADAYINALNNVVTSERINGQVLVAKSGKILLNKGYGFADKENKEEFTEDTKFLIASNTKPITATAIMQLQEKGLLNIRDPVSKYIPSQTRGNEITIEQLMTHTSGIKRDAGIDWNNSDTWKKPATSEERINRIVSQPLDFDPGTKMQYSNAAYSMLAYIIEQVSGQSYEEYMKKNIFDPAGMTSTSAISSNAALPDTAKSYSVFESQLRTFSNVKIDLSVVRGAGSICSTAADLYKLDRALYTDKILSQAALKTMYEKGYGWGTVELKGHKGVTHGGLVNGYSSQVLRFVEDDLTVIILMNVNNVSSMGLSLAQTLAGIALGEHYQPLEKKERISLGEEEMKKFAGRYKLENGQIGEVKSDNGYIYLEPATSNTNRFVPCSANEFYEEGSEYRRLIFTKDQHGNIDGFTFQDCAVEVKLKRIE